MHRRHVAHRFANQCTGNRAGDRDFVFFQIGLIVADDLIDRLFIRFNVDQLYRGAKDDTAILLNLFGVDELCMGEFAFELRNTAFDKALTLFCGVIFCVFGQVTLCAGLGDLQHHHSQQCSVYADGRTSRRYT